MKGNKSEIKRKETRGAEETRRYKERTGDEK